MSTEFINDQWRLPNAWNGTESNVNKQSNYSMDFDSQYIDTTDKFDFIHNTKIFSISVWVKMDSYNTNVSSVILGNNYTSSQIGFQFWIDNRQNAAGRTEALKFNLWDGTNSSDLLEDNVVSDNNWHNYVVVGDGTTLKYYKDGTQLTDTDSLPASTSSTAFANLRLGANTNSTPSAYLDGKIDGVSIYNYALSPSQVTTLWGGGTSVSNPMALPSPPIAYYPLGTSAFNGQYLAENNAIGDYVFDFDGSNGYVDYGYAALTAISGGSSTLTTSMTISIWFKLNNATSEKGLIYFGDLSNNYGGFTIRHYASKFNFLRGSSHIITGGYSFTDTTSWHNMTLVYDPTNASNCYLYIDGSDTGVTFNASVGNIDFLNSNLSQRSLIIGTYYNTSYIFNGEMSNVQIWNKELIDSEVQTLYNYGSPIRTLANIPQNSNLKAWYKLDASEVYNSTTTEWSIDNNQNPSPKSSLSFNNGSTRVLFNSSSLNITSALTVSGWFRIPTSNTGGGGTNIQFFLNEDNTGGTARNWSAAWRGTGFNYVWFAVFHNDGTSISINSGSNFTPNDGEWHHYFGTWDGTTNTNSMKLYIDNELVGEDTPLQTGIRATSTVGTTLGAVAESYSWSFEGELSNWAVWNSSQLSELSNIYNQGAPATTYTNTSCNYLY
jgi:hypothetical protein